MEQIIISSQNLTIGDDVSSGDSGIVCGHNLSNLPMEIFQGVIDEMVRVIGLKRTTRLRMVNKAFNEAVLHTLLVGDYLDPDANPNCLKLPKGLYIELLRKKFEAVEGQKSQLASVVDSSMEVYMERFSESIEASREEMISFLLRSVAERVPIDNLEPFLSATSNPVNTEDSKRGALIIASCLGNLTAIQDLYRESDHSISAIFSSAIIAASLYSQLEAVSLLLSLGPNTVEKLPTTNSALTAACTVGNLEIVIFLLRSRRYDGDIVSQDWFSAARAAVSGRFIQIVKLLLGDKEIWKIQKILFMSCCYGSLEIFDWIVEEGADIHARKRRGWAGGGGTAIEDAAEWGHLEIVKRLVELGVKPEGFGRAVAKAEMGRHGDVVDFLVGCDGSVEARNKEAMKMKGVWRPKFARNDLRPCRRLEDWAREG